MVFNELNHLYLKSEISLPYVIYNCKQSYIFITDHKLFSQNFVNYILIDVNEPVIISDLYIIYIYPYIANYKA